MEDLRAMTRRLLAHLGDADEEGEEIIPHPATSMEELLQLNRRAADAAVRKTMVRFQLCSSHFSDTN